MKRSVSSVPIVTSTISPTSPKTNRLKNEDTRRGRNRMIAYTPRRLKMPWTTRVRMGDEASEENKLFAGGWKRTIRRCTAHLEDTMPKRRMKPALVPRSLQETTRSGRYAALRPFSLAYPLRSISTWLYIHLALYPLPGFIVAKRVTSELIPRTASEWSSESIKLHRCAQPCHES